MLNRRTLGAVIGSLVAVWGAASRQTPPTPAELAAYRGLHAAAAEDSPESIQRMVRDGGDLNARDVNGRTPLQVEAFMGQGTADSALIAGGADLVVLAAGLFGGHVGRRAEDRAVVGQLVLGVAQTG